MIEIGKEYTVKVKSFWFQVGDKVLITDIDGELAKANNLTNGADSWWLRMEQLDGFVPPVRLGLVDMEN